MEHLAGSLGLSVSASAAGGNNYAWGGAKTGNDSNAPSPSVGLSVQKNTYLADHSNVADPNALFVVWGGGNDALGGDVSASASNLGSIITDLAHAGAKNFLVPNLPDVGLLHPLAAQHNAALSTVLDNLDHTLAVNLTRFDVNALFNAVIADAGNGGHVFGLTNVSFPCFDGRNVCADPSSFLFWDTVHPTAAGHQIIGAAAFAQLAVPLPAGIWLLASAFATINVARRRRM